MMVKDKALKVMVNVCDAKCPTYQCYWARPNPGMFLQGRGYKSYGDQRDKEYICGTRAIRGCPDIIRLMETKKGINHDNFKSNS